MNSNNAAHRRSDDIDADRNFTVVDSRKKRVLLSFSKTILTVQRSGRFKLECPLYQVLWAEVSVGDMLHLSLLHRKRSGFVLWKTSGRFHPALHDAATAWTRSLMKMAYGECSPRRRLKIIINPHGGPGKALSIFGKTVKPILEAANCHMEVLVTEYHKHCYDHAKTMPLHYDAIVLLSGDGLIHDVFNALSDREDSMNALAIPVVPVPTGSANGLSICILGLKDGRDVGAAALNAIKGRDMKIDLCSVRQDGKRIVSFQAQTIGIMADVCLGTEGLRWMGGTRFMVGFLREVGVNRACAMKLEIKVAAQDKQKMVQTYRAMRPQLDLTSAQSEPTDADTLRSGQPRVEMRTRGQSQPTLPPLKQDSEGWATIDMPLLYVFFSAGKLPFVTRDLMQFPVALSDDGFIDIVAQERISRTQLLKNIRGAAQGKQYWMPTQHYFKASAYRITPHAENGHIAIDGERYPHVPFEVEIHPRMGTTLGRGGWHPEF